jgi:hypothetical protein
MPYSNKSGRRHTLHAERLSSQLESLIVEVKCLWSSALDATITYEKAGKQQGVSERRSRDVRMLDQPYDLDAPPSSPSG